MSGNLNASRIASDSSAADLVLSGTATRIGRGLSRKDNLRRGKMEEKALSADISTSGRMS